MKKYYVVNSQEDEDGSVLYSRNSTINKEDSGLQALNFLDKITSKELDSVKMYPHEGTLFPVQIKRRNEK